MSTQARTGSVEPNRKLPPMKINRYEIDITNIDLCFKGNGKIYPTYKDFMAVLPLMADNPKRLFHAAELMSFFGIKRNTNANQRFIRKVSKAVDDGLIYVHEVRSFRHGNYYQLTNKGERFAKLIVK